MANLAFSANFNLTFAYRELLMNQHRTMFYTVTVNSQQQADEGDKGSTNLKVIIRNVQWMENCLLKTVNFLF